MRDDWIMGRDPKAPRKYDGIEVILRDRAQIERFAGETKGWRKKEPHPLAVNFAQIIGEAAGQDTPVVEEAPPAAAVAV
jgi:hypothetical protein